MLLTISNSSLLSWVVLLAEPGAKTTQLEQGTSNIVEETILFQSFRPQAV